MTSRMFAEFLEPRKTIEFIAADDQKKSDERYALTFTESANGRITRVTGPIQQVMFLIGAVAGAGHDSLYRAQVL